MLWEKTFEGGEYARGVAVDGYDNIIVVGESKGANEDFLTIKYDSNGNKLWSIRYDGGADDHARGVAVDSENNIIVTGDTWKGEDYAEDYLTIKYGVALPSGAAITISFDDGYLNLYSNAYPILQKHDFDGTGFVITGLVGDWFEGRELMEVSHLRTLSSSGWEISSHSVSHPHLSILALVAIENELRESKKWIQENGFSTTAFSYPFGDHNSQVRLLCNNYYHYGRTVEQGLNDISKENMRLKAVCLHEESVNQCKEKVREAKEQGKWLIIIVHGVVEDESELPQPIPTFGWITTNKFEEFIQFVADENIPVKTFAEVYNSA